MTWELFQLLGVLLLFGAGTYYVIVAECGKAKDDWWDDVNMMD